MTITKDLLQRHNIPVIDIQDTITEKQQHTLNALKDILPNIINGDGKVNLNALYNAVGGDNVAHNRNGYELNFAGKGIANYHANPDTGSQRLQFVPEQSKQVDSTENIIIRGDNIEVLKILYQNYHQKIKMIYIDPPYNTASDNFVYNDNFRNSEKELIEKLGLTEQSVNYLNDIYGTQNHSGWLSFMYPRLKLARELLTDDGVIFISIDDNEQANLKVICDEIFGENNFVANMIVKGSSNKSGDSVKIQTNNEHIIVYSKNISNVKILKVDEVEETWRNLNDAPTPLITSPNCGYTIYYNSITEEYKPVFDYDKNKISTNQESAVYTNDETLISDGFIPIRPGIRNGNLHRWRWGIEEFEKRKSKIKIQYKNGVYKAGFIQSGYNAPRNFLEFSSGTNQLKKIFDGKKIFDNPKNVDMVKRLCTISLNQNDIILDFFAGSGTTAHAVMDLNASDGGNRKYIMVQWDEKIDPKKSKEAYDFCMRNNFKPVISSITIDRINRAGNTIKSENPDWTGDIGYKVFKTTYKDHIATDAETGEVQYHISDIPKPLDILYNMLCATGHSLLHAPITPLIDNALYEVDNNIYIVGKIDINALAPYTGQQIYAYHRSGLSLQEYLNIQQTHKDKFSTAWG